MGIIKLAIKDFSRWIFWYPFRWLVTILPISWAYKLGYCMAYFLYLLNTRRKEKTRSELMRMDLGMGISADAIPHLFEKFYRDPAHRGHAQGVGLGLPLVKHIMEAHHGTVEVESSCGKG